MSRIERSCGVVPAWSRGTGSAFGRTSCALLAAVAVALASTACNRSSDGPALRPSAVGASYGAPSRALPGDHAVDFPPRNEPFDFRAQLEVKYRDGLHRTATSTFVDLEGDIVWTQEYLRYRVNRCDHPTAVAKVFAQIDGGGIQPVCGSGPSGQVLFPPRNEPFDFRQQLEAKYRDGLHRTATSTFVDIEGDIVWTQEYLRYRVNSCGHAEAADRVFRQIDGGGVQPDCQPISGSNLSGTWSGTGTYPNAPFTLTLIQTGSRLRGSYRDQHDSSVSVDGTLNGDFMSVNVNFGDAGLLIEGEVQSAQEVRGTMRTSALGNRPFAFTMRR
jgi:hypothetical protein